MHGTRDTASDRRYEPDHLDDFTSDLTRQLMLVTGVAYLAWHFAATTPGSANPVIALWLIFFAVAPLLVLAYRWLPQRLAAAQALWLLTLYAGIAATLLALHRPEVALAAALLPAFAVLTAGPRATLAALVGTSGLAVALIVSYGPLHTPQLGLAVFVLAGLALIAVWLTRSASRDLATWSVGFWHEAERRKEEAEEQKVMLAQTQADLLQANRELARLTDRLKALNQVAEEARRAKEEFVANVSHELRTPLNMIIGFSEMITESPRTYGGQLPLTLLSDVAAIKRNSEHLSKLVNDVLDLSQMEAGRLTLAREWTSMTAMIDEAVLAVGALYRSKGLTLDADVAADLPLMFCDSTRIRQVILNLLSNAGRFTERGGVRLTARQEGAAVTISVADTGRGIPPADLPKLFMPFQQLDAGHSRGGSGLGLNISKRFVEMHGGRMWAESTPGQGATFYFQLPISPQMSGEPASAGYRRWFSGLDSPEPRVRTRPSRLSHEDSPPRLLVLEHGDTLRHILEHYLVGCELAAVREIEEAEAEMRRAPALAVVAHQSPRSAGAYPLGRLAELPYRTPVFGCQLAGDDADQPPAAAYLTKPVTREMLVKALAQLDRPIRQVLLVDDEPEILRLFARMLSSLDAPPQTWRAPTGRRALALLRQHRPDVMILDLVMPDMDGFAVLREKAADPTICDIPVIITSSLDPSRGPVLAESLSLQLQGGLAAADIANSIRALCELFAMQPRRDPAPPADPPA